MEFSVFCKVRSELLMSFYWTPAGSGRGVPPKSSAGGSVEAVRPPTCRQSNKRVDFGSELPESPGVQEPDRLT